MPTTVNRSSDRLDYLDAVRAFALLLGIVFHASISFFPVFIGWAVMDISTSDWVSVFMLVSHSFRMALFFLIAGFFSHLAFHQKGCQTFLQSRLVRIAVPFVMFWFLLKPLLVSGWIMGAQSMRGDADVSGALLSGFASLAELPDGLFVGTHLWFLYYLLLVTVLLLNIRGAASRLASLNKRLVDAADSVVRWLCQSPFAPFAALIPIFICLWFMPHWTIETPDKSLIPQLPVLLLYGGFFVFGWLLHRQPFELEHFGRLTWGRGILCLLACGAAVLLSEYEFQPMHPRYVWIKAAYTLSYAVVMWTLIGLTIGLCQRCFTRPRPVVRYLADASYWLYLVHLPLIIWLQVAMAELPWHWALKLAVIVALTLCIALLSYALLVRGTWFGRMLNGRKTSSGPSQKPAGHDGKAFYTSDKHRIKDS